MTEAEIIATGKKWVGSGIRSFSSSIKSLIESSNDVILLTAYIISEENVVKYIINALERGVSVNIFMNDSDQIKNSSVLLKLGNEFHNLRIFKIKEAMLHSKVLISDGSKLIIGSANLTHSGLYRNYEIGLLIEDEDTAFEMEKLIRRLIE